MSVITQRVIWDDNGTLKDLSASLNRYHANPETIPLVAAEDKLYIGSELPFNHRYVNMTTANTAASIISSIEVWSGSAWVGVVDIIDQTQLGSATFGQSGIFSFSVARNSSWSQEATTEDVTGLSSLKIYNLYWMRLTFSADLDAGTQINYIGHKFSDDSALAPNGYRDLERADVKTGYEAGKTNWDEQHIAAAEEILRFLKKNRTIWSANQVLDWGQFEQPSIHKTAEIAFRGFGDDFATERNEAKKLFETTMNQGVFVVDRDEDGKVDERERRFTMTLGRV